MHLSRGKKYQDGRKYTLYGQWYYMLCEKLRVDDREMSKRTGIHFSTFNVHTRVGKSDPSVETVKQVLDAFHQIAQEKSIAWNALWDAQLYHAAHHATPDDELIAQAVLEQIIAAEQEKR